MKIEEKKRYRGTWFIPNSKNEVRGELRYSIEGGVELFLDGILGENNVLEYDIINGRLDNGVAISLVNCIIFKQTYSIHNTSNIKATFLFTGVCFKTLKQISFNEFSYSCTNLNEWLWKDNFEITENFEERMCIVKYRFPQSRAITINNNVRLKFDTNVSFPGRSFVQSEAKIKEHYTIRFISKKKLSLWEFLRLKYIFDNFFVLATGCIQNTIDMFTFLPGNVNGRKIPMEIGIYCETIRNEKIKTLLPLRMPFHFKTIAHKWRDIITKWYNFFEKSDGVVCLYFSTLSEIPMFGPKRFLFMAQVLESYHRRNCYNGDGEVHKKRLEKICEQLSDLEDKKMIMDGLKHRYEPNLRKRLNELLSGCSLTDKILSLNNKTVSKKSFIQKFIDTRNYYTHYDKQLENKIDTGFSFYCFIEKVEAFIKYYLLKEMGFSSEELYKIFIKMYPSMAENINEIYE